MPVTTAEQGLSPRQDLSSRSLAGIKLFYTRGNTKRIQNFQQLTNITPCCFLFYKNL